MSCNLKAKHRRREQRKLAKQHKRQLKRQITDEIREEAAGDFVLIIETKLRWMSLWDKLQLAFDKSGSRWKQLIQS